MCARQIKTTQTEFKCWPLVNRRRDLNIFDYSCPGVHGPCVDHNVPYDQLHSAVYCVNKINDDDDVANNGEDKFKNCLWDSFTTIDNDQVSADKLMPIFMDVLVHISFFQKIRTSFLFIFVLFSSKFQ